MHDEAMGYLAKFGTDAKVVVVELGSRNINGSPRWLFPNATYIGVDLCPGVGVDVVADASTWREELDADLVISAEVFEHTHVWPQIVESAVRVLRPGGRAVFTAAGPGRVPHSAVDGGEVRADEWYANVDPGELAHVMRAAGLVDVDVDQHGPDVRATAVKAAA